MKNIIIIYTTSGGVRLSNALILAKIHCQCRAVAEHPAERIGKTTQDTAACAQAAAVGLEEHGRGGPAQPGDDICGSSWGRGSVSPLRGQHLQQVKLGLSAWRWSSPAPCSCPNAPSVTSPLVPAAPLLHLCMI